jgi:hypothetical protein
MDEGESGASAQKCQIRFLANEFCVIIALHHNGGSTFVPQSSIYESI